MQQSNERSNAFETPLSEGRKLRECPKHLIEYNVICPRCRLENGDRIDKTMDQIQKMRKTFINFLLRPHREHYSISMLEKEFFTSPEALEYLTGALNPEEAVQRTKVIRSNIAVAIKYFVEIRGDL